MMKTYRFDGGEFQAICDVLGLPIEMELFIDRRQLLQARDRLIRTEILVIDQNQLQLTPTIAGILTTTVRPETVYMLDIQTIDDHDRTMQTRQKYIFSIKAGRGVINWVDMLGWYHFQGYPAEDTYRVLWTCITHMMSEREGERNTNNRDDRNQPTQTMLLMRVDNIYEEQPKTSALTWYSSKTTLWMMSALPNGNTRTDAITQQQLSKYLIRFMQ